VGPVAKESYPLPTALTDEKAVLTAAAGLEETAVQAYFAAIRRLVRRDLRQSLASILAVEAQHVVVFRSALKLDPVPNAFIDLGL
jgi:rubrerythrin